ncbi:MAG: tetratricopeptide repeat protein [Clostridia bacterium]|nr:tetratricopeptide repeat protein [Clostridia bacterium]
MEEKNIIKAEDYEEPRCLLNMKRDNVNPIDTGRFIEKLDEYLGKNDLQGALRHLLYWREEAKSGNDLRGEFLVLNEMMGYYRKNNKKAEAYKAIEDTLEVIKKLGLEEEISGGTAYVNIATVYKTFFDSEAAIPFFEKAKVIYEKLLKNNDSRLGGLYNNLALALVDLKRYDKALSYYEKALTVMEKAENGEQEEAITYLNMANLKEATIGIEAAEKDINEYIEKAKTLLDSKNLKRNGYHAFVCEKCAPTFEYYGYFLYANELKERSKRIYEGN